MCNIALEIKNQQQEKLKAYLEQNASETLADKINNGVKIVKDGKTLLNKKTLDGFMDFALEEARKQAEKGARGAMVEDEVVYGWLIHYFEEDSIEGILYNEDGTEYKPIVKKNETKQNAVTPVAPPKKVETKKDNGVISMFDGMDDIFLPQENNTNNDVELLTFEPPNENSIFAPEIEEPPKSKLHQKYMKYQNKYPNSVVILRLGDFYEIFGENAKTIGNLLEMTITGRDIGNNKRTPMVGFPYHSFDAYLNRITKHFSVVVIENENEEKIYDTIEKVQNSDKFVHVSTGEVIEDFDFDLDIIAKLYELFDGQLEGY